MTFPQWIQLEILLFSSVNSIYLRLIMPCISPLAHDKIHQSLLRQLIYQNVCCSSACTEALMGKTMLEPEIWGKNQVWIISDPSYSL